MNTEYQAALPPLSYGAQVSDDPNKKRKMRVQRACNRCKKHKVKCDGEQPCKTCVKHGVDCEYGQEMTASPQASSSIKFNASAVSRDNYVLYLENRIRELEGTREDKQPEDVIDVSSYDKYRFHRRYQNLLPTRLGEMLYNSIPDDHKEKALLKVPRVQYYGWNASGKHYLNSRMLPPLEKLFHFPEDTQMVNALLDFFFANVNSLYGIFHEKVFRDQYASFLSNIDSDENSTRLFVAILYMILAMTMRCSSYKDVAPGLEEKLFESAHEVFLKLSFEWESFELIQAWLLTTQYLRTCHRQTSCWAALGYAIRMVKGMSLYLNKFPHKHTLYEEVKSRRIFWATYTMDKIVSFQIGRLYDLGIEYSNHEPINKFENDGWFTPEAYYNYKMARIAELIQQKDITNVPKSTFERIQVMLAELEVLPGTPANDNLCLVRHDLIMTLHMRGMFRFVNIPLSTHTDCVEPILESCRELQGIFDRVNLDFPYPSLLSLLFTTGLVSVVFINAGIETEQCKKFLTTSIKKLEALTVLTGMSQECVWALKMLNRLCCVRLSLAIGDLASIGIDHGSSSINKNKFLQFSKAQVDESFENTIPNLLENLKWFDQWMHSDLWMDQVSM